MSSGGISRLGVGASEAARCESEEVMAMVVGRRENKRVLVTLSHLSIVTVTVRRCSSLFVVVRHCLLGLDVDSSS